MKSLKEYITGFSNGTSNLAPIASLGDTPPKGAQSPKPQNPYLEKLRLNLLCHII